MAIRKGAALAGIAAGLMLMVACGGPDEKPAPAKPPAPSGRVTFKAHSGNAFTLTLSRKGKTHVVSVSEGTWNKCHVDRWYPKCK